MTYKSCDEEYHKAADQRPKKYNSNMLRIAIYIAVASLVCPVSMAGNVIDRVCISEPDDKSCCECYRSKEKEQETEMPVTAGDLIRRFCKNLTDEYCCACYSIEEVREKDEADKKKYESPMLWIGIYIAAASLVCSIAMAGDLIRGIRQKKLWFPCKFFTVNAASLTVLAAATKLLVDLTTPMKGPINGSAKLISTVFVITIMGNFLTSFASMDSNAILTNTVALGILVITITVNECIQIATGAIGPDIGVFVAPDIGVLVAIVLVCMLFLFVTLIFSVLTVPTTKRYLELKHGELHKTISNGGKLEETGKLTNQKLKEVVEKYWVMAESSNSQFVMARSVTSATCGVICLLTALLPLLFAWGQRYLSLNMFRLSYYWNLSCSYRWSIKFILIIQLAGVLVGSIAPVCRWFTAIGFNWRNLFTDNHHREFKLVETYWTQRWVEWKERPLPSRVRHLKCKKVIQHVKICVLNSGIAIQIGIVVASKLVQLISIIITLPLFSCFYYCKKLKEKLIFHDSSVSTDHGSAEQGISSPESDLNDYVLLLEGEAKLPNRILKNMCLQMNKEIRKGQNQQPKNLRELLSKSRSNFKGVADFDSSQVSNCWTLPVVTLTAIAVALPNIENHRADQLISSVSEGLSYADLVEKSFSSKGDDVLNMKRAADVAWTSIDLYRKWLDKDLRKLPLKGISVEETLQTLLAVAEKAAIEFLKDVTGGPKVLAANSMSRISQTILKEYEGNKDAHTDGSLFEQLSIMIADILGACLSNLPRVIIRKCYCSAIEEREKSVKHAARLLGETEEILEILGHHQLPCLSGDRAAYIDEWRAVMMQKETPSILSSPENETILSSPENETATSGSSELHIDVDE